MCFHIFSIFNPLLTGPYQYDLVFTDVLTNLPVKLYKSVPVSAGLNWFHWLLDVLTSGIYIHLCYLFDLMLLVSGSLS